MCPSISDLLVGLAANQQREDFVLTRCKAGKSERNAAIRVFCSRVCSCRMRARPITSNYFSFSTGLVRKSSAPALIVCTVIGTSP